MQVIATAGHVDHGKSRLVRALTGMEPDRWAEERRRGMTIDLGYAWTVLPSGEELAFVDVPGHERFATNMLAGVGPVPAALIVVAADSGWQAQTEEHVQALLALGVREAVVAITRSDLAEPSVAAAQTLDRLAGTGLEAAPVLPVSAVTGVGLAALRVALDDLAARLPVPSADERVRLWLDRSFTIRGSGTVVTGTLRAGRLRRGDHLELRGAAVAVRGLQRLGQAVEEVVAPARVAVNLRGIDAAQVRRGDVLLSPAAWCSATVVDVRLDGGEPPSHGTLHVGAAAVPVRVRRLGSPGLARLHLGRALPLQVGDRGLLRDPGRRGALGGVVVLDPAPPSLSRRGAARARATALADDDGTPDLGREVRRRRAVTRQSLRAIGVPAEEPLPGSVVAAGDWLLDRSQWQEWSERLAALTVRPSAGGLLAGGTAVAELSRALRLPDAALLAALVAGRPDLELVRGEVRRPGTVTSLRPDLEAAVGRLRRALHEQPFRAPERPELAALGLGTRELGAAAAAGALLRLPGDVVLLPDAPDVATDRLRGVASPFTLSQARQALETTRRVAVPLLEHLDRIRVTERVSGDLRRLRVSR